MNDQISLLVLLLPNFLAGAGSNACYHCLDVKRGSAIVMLAEIFGDCRVQARYHHMMRNNVVEQKQKTLTIILLLNYVLNNRIKPGSFILRDFVSRLESDGGLFYLYF